MKNWQFFGIAALLTMINTSLAKGFHFPATSAITSFMLALFFAFVATRMYLSDKDKD